MTDISILTVNYKTPELTRECIQSVLEQQDVNFEMIVVDNASGDKSVEVLSALGSKVIFLPNNENLGFGKANNQAFQKSTGRYLFLLNPDARLLNAHDLANAVAFMDEHPAFGLVGTRIVDSEGHCQNTISDHYPRQKQCSADFSKLPGKWACVLGASMVIRRDAFEKVAGFDEDYFLYAEETDLCLRMRQAGYQIGYMENVTVSHVGGASAKKLPSEQVIRRKKSAKYLFYQKHYPRKDVINMAKKDLREASLHAWFLLLKQKLVGLNQKELHKLARHQVSKEVVRSLLEKL